METRAPLKSKEEQFTASKFEGSGLRCDPALLPFSRKRGICLQDWNPFSQLICGEDFTPSSLPGKKTHFGGYNTIPQHFGRGMIRESFQNYMACFYSKVTLGVPFPQLGYEKSLSSHSYEKFDHLNGSWLFTTFHLEPKFPPQSF